MFRVSLSEDNSKTQTLHVPKIFVDSSMNFSREIQEKDEIDSWNPKEVLGHLKGGIIVYDVLDHGQDFVISCINPKIEKVTGLKKEDVVGKKITQLSPELAELGFLEILRDVNDNGTSKKCDVNVYENNELIHWSKNHFERLNSGKILSIHYDITNLKKSDEKYDKLFNNSTQGLAVLQNNHIILANNTFSKLICCSLDKIYSMSPTELNELFFNEKEDNLWKCVHELSEGKEISKQREFSVEHKDGRKQWLHCYAVQIKYHGRPAIQILFDDITERIESREALKKSEKELKIALDEKELLLREVHHRVKNNLQIIMSLISLGSRYEKGNPDDILNDTQSKIRAMALIHEKLYQSPNLTHVNIKEYIKSFIIDIFRLYDVNNNQITLKTGLEDIELNIETAIPLVLIINEIITNIIKYAFPQNQKGTIEIHLYSQIDQIVLKISDNGIGIPETINIENPETLGLTVIKALTTQLDGTIQLEKNPGTTYTITFKEQKYKKRT